MLASADFINIQNLDYLQVEIAAAARKHHMKL
jgi:hypothetical protein